MATAGSIVVDLLMRTGSFETDSARAAQNIKKIEREINRLSRTAALYATGAAAALIAATKSSANYMDEMGQAAERTSVSAQSFSELAYAAKDVSLSQGEMERILRRSTEAINHAEDGTTKQAKALKTLGVSAYDAAGRLKTADAMLLDMAEKFSELEPGARKTGLVIDLFGQQLGQKVIPLLNKGSVGIKQLAQEAKSLGLVIDDEASKAANEFNNHVARLGDAVRGAAIAITAELLPGINAYIQEQDNASGATELLASGAKLLGDNFKELVAIGSGIATVYAAVWALTGAKNIAVFTAALITNTAAHTRAVGAARLLAAVVGMAATPIGAVSLALGVGVTAWQLWGREANNVRGPIDAITRDIRELKNEFLALNDSKRRGMLIGLEEDLRKLERETDASISELLERAQSAATAAAMPDGMRPVFESMRNNILAIADSNIEASEKAELLKRTILNLEGSVPDNVYQGFLKIAVAAAESAGDAEELLSRIRQLREQIDAPVELQPNRVAPPRLAGSTKTDEGERLIKQLNERIALLGKETEYEKMLAQIQGGRYSDLAGWQKEVALDLAQQLDTATRQIETERILKDLREQQSITQRQFMRDLESFGQSDSVRDLNDDLARVEDRYRGIIEVRRSSPLGLSDDELEQIKESLDIELEMVREHHLAKKEIEQDWRLGAIKGLHQYAEEASNIYQQMSDTVSGAFSKLEDELVSFVTTGEMDLTKMLRSVGGEVVRMLVRAGLQMAANALLGQTSAAASAAMAAATGTAMAAAYAPAAAMASLASFGANSAPAMAGISSTVALTQGLALTGMAHDGIDSVPKTGTWLLEKGERVMTSDTSARLDAMLQRIERRQINEPVPADRRTALVVNLIENPDRGGEVETRTDSDGNEELNIFVADIRGAGRRAQVLEATYGLQRVGR